MKRWLSCCCPRQQTEWGEWNWRRLEVKGRACVWMCIRARSANCAVQMRGIWFEDVANRIECSKNNKTAHKQRKLLSLCFHSNWLQQCIRPIHYAFVSFVSTGAYVMLQSRPLPSLHSTPSRFFTLVCSELQPAKRTDVSVLSKSGACKSCNQTLFVHDMVRCMCAANK